jgi:hypothetical protein
MLWKRGEETGGKFLCRMYTPYGNYDYIIDLKKSGNSTVLNGRVGVDIGL